VDKIKVKKRIRQDLGDIEGLKQSMQKFGLVSPIVITQKGELIAGHRRLSAAIELGWKRIQVVRIDLENPKDKLEWEIEENIRRKDFTHAELELAYLELARLSRPPSGGVCGKKLRPSSEKFSVERKRSLSNNLSLNSALFKFG
jgi:ParB family chromosome partitioning protein